MVAKNEFLFLENSRVTQLKNNNNNKKKKHLPEWLFQ